MSRFSNNQRHRVSLVIVDAQDQILLIERHKEDRNYWVFPGGGVEDGEGVEAAAIREAMEEVSLNVEIGRKLFTLDNNGRAEIYFLINRFNGNVQLGDGPEKENQSPKNQFRPCWRSLNSLRSVNLLPLEGKEKIIDLHQTGRLT